MAIGIGRAPAKVERSQVCLRGGQVFSSDPMPHTTAGSLQHPDCVGVQAG